MDQIRIKELKIYANHGVFDFEKEKGQNFYVNAILYLDTQGAALEDNLDKTINYAEVCEEIRRFLTDNTFDLIETACSRLCEDLLLTFLPLRSVDIELRKPEAPIDMEFESVSVAMNRGWRRAVIALGSNMGDKDEYLKLAIEGFEKNDRCRVVRTSEVLTTKPYGGVEQDDFRNSCMVIETIVSPQELLKICNELEEQANRVREIHWGPRTLDVDIIFYDDEIVDDENLKIPHVDMHNRDFVLKPLCQIAPGWIHPIMKRTVWELLESLDKKI